MLHLLGPFFPPALAQVLETDGRHPCAFPVNKCSVWVVASCNVNADLQVPALVTEKMKSLGYDFRLQPQIMCLPAETSRQYVDQSSKLRIACALFKREHRKKKGDKQKAPVVCPHCGKEARGVSAKCSDDFSIFWQLKPVPLADSTDPDPT